MSTDANRGFSLKSKTEWQKKVFNIPKRVDQNKYQVKPLLVVHSVVFDFYRMAQSVDPDEMAHDELYHLDLHCLHRYLFWSARMKGLIVSIQSFQKLY